MKGLDISTLIGKTRQRVSKVGLELEGAWAKVPADARIVHDGSVKGFTSTGELSVGELNSAALKPENVKTWLTKYYPSQVNSTCGMHCHMSFSSNFLYQRLMEESFMWTVVEQVQTWALEKAKTKVLPANHCIFSRLKGESEYCQLKFHADGQAQRDRKDFDHHAPDHRYTAVNYCYKRNGTVEIRLLPMMPNAELAAEAIQLLLDVTSAYLVKTAKRELKQTVLIPSDGLGVRESLVSTI